MTRDPDRVLLRRARRAMVVQTAAAITLSLLVVGVLVLIVVVHTQHTASVDLLRRTADAYGSGVHPPQGVWVFAAEASGPEPAVAGSAGGEVPAGLPYRAALDRVAAGGAAEITELDVGGGDFLALTTRRDGRTLQVVTGLYEQEDERNRLLVALAVAELAGLLIAALVTRLLAGRATAPLAEALTRQRQFVADASHELRTPLTQLHTRAQLLQMDLRGGGDPDEIARDVDRLVTGTRRLGEVVHDLLLSSQPAKRADRTEVDLSAVVGEVVEEHAARAASQQVELATIDRCAAPGRVRGHEAALRRVVHALVDNALSHTPSGGHVTVELAADDGWVRVAVRDDGSGFDKRDAERLFARFARAGPDDHRRFGLGLALAREVAAGHGGTIEAHGEPGRGAVFTLRLPRDTARN
ncbi:sensor histidine kinase [Mangrovihabitans endophyticus]|uniref:Sensor-like histidine kinase SenX3 n=1 Tax=Mangrovihabitans endophyticus TaxID=1751298 RepID=A0A8J3C4J7_9ACTN|nr:HAMP domain-containing sensor histidine kinase [Mangrovihabitans endophyticus]GGL08962.1 two-component sensor histidine kinase [Mangrovihabitans endophyticus]